MAFAWISGFVHHTALAFSTSDVVDGVCYAYVFWKSRQSQLAYGMFNFSMFYVAILIFVSFCYVRILIAIRRQAKTMASHGTSASSTAQAQSHQIQTNVIKTMILVTAFFTISDMPVNAYYMILNVNENLTLLESGWYASLFIFFFYFCANPFIYAAKFNPVKQILLRMIPCMKTPVQPVEIIQVTSSRVAATRSAQEHN